VPNSSPGSGILVAVEGIDGAGKTTQVSRLTQALRHIGEAVVSSKEPTTGQWGSILRKSAQTGRLSLPDELAMFINDRTEHVAQLIQPNLDAGSIVILDRYFYSTIAYQGARGADVKSVSEEMVSRFPIPDAVFILDVDPVVGIHRIANDRGEEPNHFEDRSSLADARSIFNQLQGDNIRRIDGSKSILEVGHQIMDLFVGGPLKKKRCAKVYGCDDPFHCSFRLSGTCEWWNLKEKLRAQRGVSAPE
jgi:dTMP kinase